MLLPSFALLYVQMFYLPLNFHVIFFTLWGSDLTMIALILSILSGLDSQRKNTTLKKYAGLACELALAMQFIITVVYWPALHN